MHFGFRICNCCWNAFGFLCENNWYIIIPASLMASMLCTGGCLLAASGTQSELGS